PGQVFGEMGRGLLAVSGHELGECREQARLRQAIEIDAVEPCFGPGLLKIAQGSLLLFEIARRLVGRRACNHGHGESRWRRLAPQSPKTDVTMTRCGGDQDL